MAMLPIFAALLALAGYTVFLVRHAGVPAGAAPLAALSGVLLVCLAGGMAGQLEYTGYAVLCIGWIILAQQLLAQHNESWRTLLSPGSLFFWGGAVLLLLRLAWLEPEFTAFDEYSFWGTAAKLTSLSGKLYTVCETGLPWQMTEFAALPLASYFFQMFGGFLAWRAIFAADILILAGLAAVIACAEKAGRRVWAPLALALILMPAAFTVNAHTAYLNTAWLSFLGDIPAGVLFGAAAAYWFAVREKGAAARWLTLPVICLAANIKSNTFVLALAAAGILAADGLFFPRADAPKTRKALAARGGFAAACLAAPCMQYIAWNRYTAILVAQNAAAGGYGDTQNDSLGAIVISGIRMLLGGQGDAFCESRRGELFAYRDTLLRLLWQEKVSLLGTGAALCALVLAIFLLAALAAPLRRERCRVLLAAVCSGLCFLGYQLMLLLSYAFILKDSSPDAPASYARYAGSYYFGWLMLALAVFGIEAAAGGAKRLMTVRAGALALGVGAAFAVGAGCEAQFTVLGVPRAEYTALRAERQTAEMAAAQLAPGARMFLVVQGDDGFHWFLQAQALLPCIAEYGAGGNSYSLPEYQQESYYTVALSQDAFRTLIKDSGAQYLYIAQSDEAFEKSYAALFSDALAAAQQGPAVYRITPEEDTLYTPLHEEAAQ